MNINIRHTIMYTIKGMGVYYYIVNHTKKIYCGHFGKRGEFDEESICFELGWLDDHIESVSEHNLYDITYDYEKDTFIYAHIESTFSDDFVYRIVYNVVKREKHVLESSSYLTSTTRDELLCKLNWKDADPLIFTNISRCCATEHNCDNYWEILKESDDIDLYTNI